MCEAIQKLARERSISVVAHMLIGLGFAMLLNSELVSRTTRAVFRTLFVLPWLLTIAIVAVLWRLLLNPNGIVNAILSGIGLVVSQHEWLSDPGSALAVVTAINIWSGYPFFMISILAGLQGIPRDLYTPRNRLLTVFRCKSSIFFKTTQII